MLSSRVAGIPISSSTIRRARTASVADSRGADGASLQQLKWPASSRNGGRLRFGTVAGIKSESVAGLRRNSQGRGTRLPGSVSGVCRPVPRFPRSPPLAPPAPHRIAPLRSSASRLLWRSLTSHVRSSSATAPRLPGADRHGVSRPARNETSRFPCRELTHMPGSSTTQDR